MTRPSTRRSVLRSAAAGLAVAATGALLAAPAAAQTAWPARPIRIIWPFAPGGAGDSAIRMVSRHLSEALGQPVVVDNKPGASGTIGMQEAARAAPDGYTLVFGSSSTMAANMSLLKRVPYDMAKDFEPVSRLGVLPFLLVSSTTLPVTTVKELVQYAKANPGKVSFANHSAPGHVAGVMLAQATGIDMLRVPYKVSTVALQEMIAGQVSIMFIDVAPALPLVKAGRIRALGMATQQRSSLMPEMPTVSEGLDGARFDLVQSWMGLAAPAGTPAPIIARLNAELGKILRKPEVKEDLARLFIEASPSSPEELREFIKADTQKWAEMVKAAGIEPQ
ncbi:MAG: tripartite tricarboxylate transporter substrate binding protein [Pseudomonadota bacterium]